MIVCNIVSAQEWNISKSIGAFLIFDTPWQKKWSVEISCRHPNSNHSNNHVQNKRHLPFYYSLIWVLYIWLFFDFFFLQYIHLNWKIMCVAWIWLKYTTQRFVAIFAVQINWMSQHGDVLFCIEIPKIKCKIIRKLSIFTSIDHSSFPFLFSNI